MGTDIFQYTVLSIKGKELIVEYYSGQSVGLAELTSSFWVDALCSTDNAFKWDYEKGNKPVRLPNCTLTQHELFRTPTGEVVLEGPTLKSEDDLEALVEKVNKYLIQAKKITKPLSACAWDHVRFNGKEWCDINFNSIEQANLFIETVYELETKRINDARDGSDISSPLDVYIEPAPLDVYFKAVKNGPQWISKYGHYSKEVFDHFVASIEQLEVFYENLHSDDTEAWKEAGIEENYWNTKAKYKITMTDPAYLDHLKVGVTWNGR